MIGGLWRRIRSVFSGDGTEAGQSAGDVSAEPEPTSGAGYFAPPEGSQSTDWAAYLGAEPAATPEPTPVDRLAERLSMRLAEDETLRGGLTDEEYQPLLDWATSKIAELAELAGRLPPAAAEAHFNRVGGQLLDLVRAVDSAVGERRSGPPELAAGRFQVLDTLLTPPLLMGPVATQAQARLELLLGREPATLQSADGAELVREIVELLG